MDEVDSILIDNCHSPMIISMPDAEQDMDRFRMANEVCSAPRCPVQADGSAARDQLSAQVVRGCFLKAGRRADFTEARSGRRGDYIIDVERRSASLTEAGMRKVLDRLGETVDVGREHVRCRLLTS